MDDDRQAADAALEGDRADDAEDLGDAGKTTPDSVSGFGGGVDD